MTSLRHEVKFTVRRAQLAHVRGWLRASALLLRPAYPPRLVHNLYFDTFDYAGVAEKLAGTSQRHKVRYRWYGASALPAPGALEVKRRHNVYGDKLTFPVAVELPATPWRAFLGALRAALPVSGRAWLDEAPQPVLLNTYRREYLATPDGDIRATLDADLQVFDQRRSAGVQVGRPAPMPDVGVLELKFAPEARQRVVEAMGALGLVAVACSKYVLGVQAIAAG